MSFQQGLSGLNAAARNLDVIGNNVANSNTVGFKGSRAVFSDVYAASLSGSGGTAIGIGTSVAEIQQLFTQGNVTVTNNPLDLAINGGGLFRMASPSGVTYSRNGQFHLDNQGVIVNSESLALTGYPVDAQGNVVTSAPQPLQIQHAQPAGDVEVDVGGVEAQAAAGFQHRQFGIGGAGGAERLFGQAAQFLGGTIAFGHAARQFLACGGQFLLGAVQLIA